MWTRRKRAPATWVIVMLTLNFALFPLEILLEAGAYERHRCTPISVQSTGICASKWNGHSKYGISAAAQSTLRLNWADRNWSFVGVGSLKTPETSEVRIWENQLSAVNRTYVAHKCSVHVGGCPISGCGTLTFRMTKAKLFGNCLRDWSHRPKIPQGHEDQPTYDKIGGIAYMFWRGGTEIDATRSQFNGTFIHVHGLEALLSDDQMNQISRVKHSNDWQLALVPSQTRTYKITCKTDGLIDEDLAMGIGTYCIVSCSLRCVANCADTYDDEWVTNLLGLLRTAQMEYASLTRQKMQGLLKNFAPLNSSDIVKAAFSVKAEDHSDSCEGTVDRYQRCGAFKNAFFIPFFIVSGIIILFWIVVITAIRDVNTNVPVSINQWRETALGNLNNMDREHQEKKKMGQKTSLAKSELDYINSIRSGDGFNHPQGHPHDPHGSHGFHGSRNDRDTRDRQDAVLNMLQDDDKMEEDEAY